MTSIIKQVTLSPLTIPSGGSTTATIDYEGSGTIYISGDNDTVKPASTDAPAGQTRVTVVLTVTGEPGECEIEFDLDDSTWMAGLTVTGDAQMHAVGIASLGANTFRANIHYSSDKPRALRLSAEGFSVSPAQIRLPAGKKRWHEGEISLSRKGNHRKPAVLRVELGRQQHEVQLGAKKGRKGKR